MRRGECPGAAKGAVCKSARYAFVDSSSYLPHQEFARRIFMTAPRRWPAYVAEVRPAVPAPAAAVAKRAQPQDWR